MTASANYPNSAPIDPAFVAEIVRRVIARLQQTDTSPVTSKTAATAASIADRVVTAKSIEKVQGTPSQIFVSPDSVVTPAAYDAANSRGIEINKTIEVVPAQRPRPLSQLNNQEISDSDQPQRAASIYTQLARRGITRIGSRIVLSDTPSVELHHCITTDSSRATMVGCIADVDRFQRELQPNVWVLDMGRMNLMTAVNAVARIAHFGN